MESWKPILLTNGILQTGLTRLHSLWTESCTDLEPVWLAYTRSGRVSYFAPTSFLDVYMARDQARAPKPIPLFAGVHELITELLKNNLHETLSIRDS